MSRTKTISDAFVLAWSNELIPLKSKQSPTRLVTPRWLELFQQNEHVERVEGYNSIVVPKAILEFWREPELMYVVQASTGLDFFSYRPRVQKWVEALYLTFAFHNHSSTFAGVRLDQGNDPKLAYGFIGNDSWSDYSPDTKLFSEFVYDTVQYRVDHGPRWVNS